MTRSPRRTGRTITAAVALTTSLGVLAAPAAADRSRLGSPGVGDSYFPHAGNGGYDVGQYALDIT